MFVPNASEVVAIEQPIFCHFVVERASKLVDLLLVVILFCS